MSNGDSNEYLSLDLAMRRLRLSRRQVYRYAQEGRIRTLPTRNGQMYHRGDVERLAEALKVDERPQRSDVGPPRPPPQDRAELSREIDEIRQLRAELAEHTAELRQQRQLTAGRAEQVKEQDAQLARILAELQAARDALARPFYTRWEFWAVVILAAALVAVVILR